MEEVTEKAFFERAAYSVFVGGRTEGGAVVFEFLEAGGREVMARIEQGAEGPIYFMG